MATETMHDAKPKAKAPAHKAVAKHPAGDKMDAAPVEGATAKPEAMAGEKMHDAKPKAKAPAHKAAAKPVAGEKMDAAPAAESAAPATTK